MKRAVPLMLLVIFSMASVSLGKVSTKICMADGNTPFPPAEVNLPYIIYPDIMVGTKLTVFLESNMAKEWTGGALGVPLDMIDVGHLEGLDCDANKCPGSCLLAAGEHAEAWIAAYPEIGVGFDLNGGEKPEVGDWFIFDYNATGLGDCNVGFYDHNSVGPQPVEVLLFHHVRTRDFNGDTVVDFFDFAMLASHWEVTDCNEPDWCQGTDLDIDERVDFNDLMLFCEYWLEKTE